MNFDIKKMEKAYKKKTIDQCVADVKKLNEEMIQRGEELIELLFYLEKSKRYCEYDGYKKLPFRVFVSEICHIPYNRYRELAYAYNWYPEESRKYGPQTIQAIKSKVGVVKVPKVIKEIEKRVGKIKTDDPLKKREVISAVIEKHAPTVKASPKTVEDTKGYWRRRYEKLHDDYQALLKENKELRAQVERQKAPIRAFMKIQDQVRKHGDAAGRFQAAAN